MLDQVLNQNIKLAALILAVLLFRHLFKTALTGRLRQWLWLPVLIRALIPLDLFPALPGLFLTTKRLSAMLPDATVSQFHLVAVAVYFAGIIFFSLRFLRMNRRLVSTLKANRRPVRAEQIALPVYTSSSVRPACLVSYRRETAIYINPDLFADASRAHHVLVHETMHAAQRDPLWNRLRALVLILHWFNPLVWIAASCFIDDSECACDERTVMALGQEQKSRYARTLLSLVLPSGIDRSRPYLQANAIQINRQDMKTRLMLLASKKRSAKLAAPLLAMLLALCLLISFSADSLKRADVSSRDAVLPPFSVPSRHITNLIG